MLDERKRLCPNVFEIINSFKINWDNVPGGKRRVTNMIPIAVLEVYKYGEVSDFSMIHIVSQSIVIMMTTNGV